MIFGILNIGQFLKQNAGAAGMLNARKFDIIAAKMKRVGDGHFYVL